MEQQITELQVRNFRSLADVTLSPGRVNVLFGPNGSGKSTLLDTIWFLRDCLRRGVDEASSDRSHGIGALWDLADEGEKISIKLKSTHAEYKVEFGYSSGRIEPFAGEVLYSKKLERDLITRFVGSDTARFYHYAMKQVVPVSLRDPENLALTRYLDFQDTSDEASEMRRLLQFTNLYHARNAYLYRLKKLGSESNHHTHLWENCDNLWSVLRNIHGRRSLDERYETIIDFMRRAFPTFRDLVIEQTGPNTVYGSFIEIGRREPIQASGVSDGHLQMLAHLTALFSTGGNRDNVIIFDEPETSLHPYALQVFADAVKHSAEKWSNQIFIATHSPVLVSQFEPADIWAVGIGERGETTLDRVSEITEIQDLLQEYAIGSLYMAEMVASQSNGRFAEAIK